MQKASNLVLQNHSAIIAPGWCKGGAHPHLEGACQRMLLCCSAHETWSLPSSWVGLLQFQRLTSHHRPQSSRSHPAHPGSAARVAFCAPDLETAPPGRMSHQDTHRLRCLPLHPPLTPLADAGLDNEQRKWLRSHPGRGGTKFKACT